jgi:hypothetical protein
MLIDNGIFFPLIRYQSLIIDYININKYNLIEKKENIIKDEAISPTHFV